MTRARLPCSLHFPDQSLRTKVSIIQHSFSPEVTSLPTDSTHYSFSSIRAVVYGFSSNMRSKLVGLRRIILVFIWIFFATRTRHFSRELVWYVHTRRTFYEARQGCGVVSCTTLSCWGACGSKLLVFIWYHTYVREDYCFGFFIEILKFSFF